MVGALSKLHNFCIDEEQKHMNDTNPNAWDTSYNDSSALDEFHIMVNDDMGYISLEQSEQGGNESIP